MNLKQIKEVLFIGIIFGSFCMIIDAHAESNEQPTYITEHCISFSSEIQNEEIKADKERKDSFNALEHNKFEESTIHDIKEQAYRDEIDKLLNEELPSNSSNCRTIDDKSGFIKLYKLRVSAFREIRGQ